jgi:hypothetical protein
MAKIRAATSRFKKSFCHSPFSFCKSFFSLKPAFRHHFQFEASALSYFSWVKTGCYKGAFFDSGKSVVCFTNHAF